jgi:hypothetical protein
VDVRESPTHRTPAGLGEAFAHLVVREHVVRHYRRLCPEVSPDRVPVAIEREPTRHSRARDRHACASAVRPRSCGQGSTVAGAEQPGASLRGVGSAPNRSGRPVPVFPRMYLSRSSMRTYMASRRVGYAHAHAHTHAHAQAQAVRARTHRDVQRWRSLGYGQRQKMPAAACAPRRRPCCSGAVGLVCPLLEGGFAVRRGST